MSLVCDSRSSSEQGAKKILSDLKTAFIQCHISQPHLVISSISVTVEQILASIANRYHIFSPLISSRTRVRIPRESESNECIESDATKCNSTKTISFCRTLHQSNSLGTYLPTLLPAFSTGSFSLLSHPGEVKCHMIFLVQNECVLQRSLTVSVLVIIMEVTGWLI